MISKGVIKNEIRYYVYSKESYEYLYRKVTVMAFKRAMQITFTIDEVEGDEMEDDLKEYMRDQLEKIATEYWDYKSSH
jgi:hypothetical protein